MCDFGNLADEIKRLTAAGVTTLHLDCMDGHFVPNLSYGPLLVEAVRRNTDLCLDVHLMLADPLAYLEAFSRAGADILTIHIEATPDPGPVLRQIRALGVAAGLALNPPTPVTSLEPYLGDCDLVLVMSVMPGFGGQAFDPVAVEKLRQLRALAPPGLRLEVDGGVNESTIASCAEAGADWFVVGSGVFRHSNYAAAVSRLSNLVGCQPTLTPP
jgi:ribulose-phosphate 3-epimerase